MATEPNGRVATQILGIFNSWAQFGAVGVMAVILCLVTGGGLYFISSMLKSSSDQHAADVKQLVDARNREMDAFVQAIKVEEQVQTKALQGLLEQNAKNGEVSAELIQELRNNRALANRILEKMAK